MTRRIVTHNDFHAGDNLIFLHLLRKLSEQHPDCSFTHFANTDSLRECAPIVEDRPNIELLSFNSEQWRQNAPISINTWKNYADQWVQSAKRWNWSGHALEHHAWTAARMGLKSPFTCREHLLFDYPALNPNGTGDRFCYDFLIINSEPCSGQFKPMAEHGSGYLDEFTKRLARKFNVITTNPVFGVECTRDSKKNLTDIGRLSLMCCHHIMVATGPMWPTLNTTNHHNAAGRKRLVLLDNGEQINMPNIQQVETLAQIEAIAGREGWLW